MWAYIANNFEGPFQGEACRKFAAYHMRRRGFIMDFINTWYIQYTKKAQQFSDVPEE